jgi:hypothetical protein
MMKLLIVKCLNNAFWLEKSRAKSNDLEREITMLHITYKTTAIRIGYMEIGKRMGRKLVRYRCQESLKIHHHQGPLK